MDWGLQWLGRQWIYIKPPPVSEVQLDSSRQITWYMAHCWFLDCVAPCFEEGCWAPWQQLPRSKTLPRNCAHIVSALVLDHTAHRLRIPKSHKSSRKLEEISTNMQIHTFIDSQTLTSSIVRHGGDKNKYFSGVMIVMSTIYERASSWYKRYPTKH